MSKKLIMLKQKHFGKKFTQKGQKMVISLDGMYGLFNLVVKFKGFNT